VRRRILVAMVAVTALAVTAFAIPLGLVAASLYRGREVSRLEREAIKATAALPEAGLHGTTPIVLPRSSVQLSIYDTAGQLVAGVGSQQGGSEVTSALRGVVTNHHDGRLLAVAVPIHDEGDIVGAARAALPWDVVADDTLQSWGLVAALGLLAVALAAGLAWRQSSRLVAPIESLTGVAMQLGDSDFTATVTHSGVEEIDRAGAALNRTASRLGAAIARERAFSADVSHQLNTPLTSLRLSIESALLSPDEDARASLELALAEVDRLQTTVATLLAVARDTDAIPSSEVDVATVCTEMAGRRRGDLEALGRSLHLEVDARLPKARFSADVLREILAVLLDNAIQHGGGTVSVLARPAGLGVVVEVADEGEGVIDTDRVFERLAPEATGHGIGLALARSLAEAHGGRLQLARHGPHPSFMVALPGVGDHATAAEPRPA
jgi:signal transduction histidine kinase